MMKIHRIIYLTMLLMACLCVSCDGAMDDEEHKHFELDTLRFSQDHKTALLDARLIGSPVLGDPSDTTLSKYVLFETSDIDNRLLEQISPKIVRVRNIMKEQMKGLDLKLLVIVDLTMEQPMVNEAKVALENVCNLFPQENIYVSFMTDKDNVTESVPLMSSMLEQDFVSVSDSETDKYLYRNLLAKLRECYSGSDIHSNNKTVLLLSDGVVWGNDSPLDPDHFLVQQQLLDYAEGVGTALPVFFAGMSSDEELDAETNTTMQLICARTGGVCSQGFNLEAMHSALCDVYNVKDVDFQYELEYPDNRVFWGEQTNIYLQCMQRDSLVAYGKYSYCVGTFFEPYVVNGPTIGYLMLSALLFVLLVLVVCYLVLQFFVPYIKYRIFQRKYVAPYTGAGMSIAGRLVSDTCYFCKAPFMPGELVVGRCDHSMHKECWDENNYHCTEYGVRCPDGSHYYDHHNLFNPSNAPYYMKWVIIGILATLMAWLSFYLLPASLRSGLLGLLLSGFMDEEKMQRVWDFAFRLPSSGFLISAFFVAAVSFLTRKRLHVLMQVRDICLRAFIAGVGGYVCFFLDVLICVLFRIDAENDLVGMITFMAMVAWMVAVASYNTGIRVRWKLVVIAYVVCVIGTIVSNTYYCCMSVDFRLQQLVTLLAYNVILILAFAYDVKRSEHYFLHVEGAVKTMDIALYKWLRNSPSAVVTIGKSVDCDLQLSWDIESDVAPMQAEIKMSGKHPCLYPLEDGVWKSDDTPLLEGDSLRLYHGTKFRIGNTLFTYIEKDK